MTRRTNGNEVFEDVSEQVRFTNKESYDQIIFCFKSFIDFFHLCQKQVHSQNESEKGFADTHIQIRM